ncbi:MAG: PH domain-containing protein [Lachnospirales bacterium]
MSNEVSNFNWIFSEKVDPYSLGLELNSFLVPGEEIITAYKTVRDVAIFTNKRVVIRDKQGLTGKKIETYTIPYKSINMYSVENAGTLDFTSEVELWTRAGHIKLNFKKDFDINLINNIIAREIL